MTTPSTPADDKFVLDGGRRANLRNRAFVLVVVIGIAATVFINAVEQRKSDAAGSVGHLVIPAATTLACLGALVVTLSQWWEALTYFEAVDGHLSVRHGTSRRGSAVRLERGEPIVFTTEGAGSGQGLFVHQGSTRIRLADARHVPPVHLARLEGWLRSHGFAARRS